MLMKQYHITSLNNVGKRISKFVFMIQYCFKEKTLFNELKLTLKFKLKLDLASKLKLCI